MVGREGQVKEGVWSHNGDYLLIHYTKGSNANVYLLRQSKKELSLPCKGTAQKHCCIWLRLRTESFFHTEN